MELSEVLKLIQPCNMDESYIFISYSAKDSEQVWRDVLKFQQMGYNVWLDEKNLDKTQASWRNDALEAIRDLNCALMVFYVSRNSLVSQPCYSELACTVEDYTKAVHFGPVKFVAVDVEPINDIVEFSREVYMEIRKKDIPKTEKTSQAITLNNCIEQFFNSNNEKVRVKPMNIPNRKMDYYEEITAAFPDDTRVLPVAEPEPVPEPVVISEPVVVPESVVVPKPEGRIPSPINPRLLAEHAMQEGNKELKKRGDYAKFTPAREMTEKQLLNAVTYIAKGEKTEDVMGMRDASLFGSGKDGIVLTRTTLYSRWAKKHPVKLQELKEVHVGSRDCHLVLIYHDGRCEDVFFNNDYLAVKAVLEVYIAHYQKYTP